MSFSKLFVQIFVLTFPYYDTSSNARLRPGDNARGTTPGGQHPGNSLITQIIDLQTLFAINDRLTVQTDTQTDRQIAFIGRDYSRKYLKMRLMVGGRGGVAKSRTVCIERSL